MNNRVYEFSTWNTNKEWKEAEAIAIEAGKNHSGNKFTVAVGEWGVRTFLVLADTKEEAKKLVLEVIGNVDDKIKVRDVTNCKKYK